MKRLFLWDIDGTLLRRAGPLHEQVLVEAIREVLGVETTMRGIPVHGMMDRDILRAMMRTAGVEDGRVEAGMAEIVRLAQERYGPRCPDLREKVCPGVREMLAAIDAPMALVTGNLTRIGWAKVERAGLREHFAVGAFADMRETRAELARLAFEMAGATADTEVTLIGDSPSDVHAAKVNGFRCVAVATGLTSFEELAALHADAVLNDLSTAADRARVLG